MNHMYSAAPCMGGFFSLALRPSKRTRSPSSQDDQIDPKRICQTSLDDDDHPMDHSMDISTHETESQREVTTTTSPNLPPQSPIDVSTLKFPAMLLKKAKRRGLPIHSQFIHPSFFIRHMDQQHPEIDFTIPDYKEAWHYAVGLASQNVHLSHLAFAHPSVAKRQVEEEIQATHDLVDNVRLKTRDEYAASRQGASVLWQNADSQRFHKLLEEKRERKRRWRAVKDSDLVDVEMDIEHDVEANQVIEGPIGLFDFGSMPIRSRCDGKAADYVWILPVDI